MPIAKSLVDLTEQLAEAQAKIAELESAIASLQAEHARAKPVPVQPPSFIIESITDAFVAVDREFRYIWVNTEAERLMGKSAAEVLGRSIWEVFPEAIGTTLDHKCRQALADQVAQCFDNYFAPGSRWFYNKAYPTSEGGLAIYWREVTEQKAAESDLRRQALVLKQIHDSIIETDLEGRITGWNHSAECIFGYPLEEALGQHVAMLYFEEDRAAVGSRIFEPLLREGHLEIQLRNRRKSGQECFIHLSLSLLRDEAEQAYGILGVATDITEQVRAERALRESEERYRCLADAMPQVAYITDPKGRTLMVNRHWEEYSGVPAEQCLGFNWLAWIHPDDVEPLMPLWIECVQGGKHFDTEYRLRNSRGEYRWHLSRAVPVRVDHVITQWVGTLTDIHELKNAEEALRNSEQRLNGKAVELAQANEELLHFAYAVSHDLRAPLRTVIAFAQLLSVNYDARLDDDGKELVLRIVNAGSRMTALLRDLLVFAEVGGMEARASETIPLAEPLATAQQNLSSEMRETGAKITWDPLPAVAGQAVRMTQLFQNLLGNSLKYRKPGTPPQIHVSAEPSGAEWVITVRDNGVGFEPRYAGTIFGVFRRLHGNEVAGTGLGLAICKRIVERMGGRIWATGEPGVGAAFSFALPVADAATESARRQ